MLVLSRRPQQKLVFPAIQTTIDIVSIKSGAVRLGIEGPRDVLVLRGELADTSLPQAVPSVDSVQSELQHSVNNQLNALSIGLSVLRRQLQLGLIQQTEETLDRIQQGIQTLQERMAKVAYPTEPSLAPFTLSSRCQSSQASPAASVSPSSTRSRLRALLVEDDNNERELLAGLLRMAGMEVQTAGDGADALDHLRVTQKPDIVLLDMILPRCDGPTMVRTVREDPRMAGLKIFGLTGADHQHFGLTEGPSGIDRWFRKPVDPETLLRAVTRDIAS